MSTYAIIRTGGKQYLVKPGQEIVIETLAIEPGKQVTFDEVLMIGGDELKLGAPFVTGGKVTGTVVKHGKSKKVTGVKFHNKVRYRRTFGHRQNFTAVKIDKIS